MKNTELYNKMDLSELIAEREFLIYENSRDSRNLDENIAYVTSLIDDKEPVDCFILTFKVDDSDRIVQFWDGKIGVSQGIHDATKGKAKYYFHQNSEAEISLSFGDFLELKNERYFQSKCNNLVRLRTSKNRSLIGKLAFPIAHIDNLVPR